ncbi:hypothetical protein EJB05_22388, partial [Eragrostis curvula]
MALKKWGLERCVPGQDESSFANWWRRAIKKVQKEEKKGLNSHIILGAWFLWKHRSLAQASTTFFKHLKMNTSCGVLQGLEAYGHLTWVEY